ncbi:MAG: inositol monophosphatase family protein [Acetobacteraceae bacterium]
MNDPAIEERAAVLNDTVMAAGRMAVEFFAARDRLEVSLKGPQDFVTEADRAVEDLLAARLAVAFPGDGFLGEETGFREGSDVWVVDPIDGTANFVRGIPHFCVNVAFVRDGRTELGATYNPIAGELYFARRGHGATRNGAAIAVAPTPSLSEAAVEVGWSTRVPNAAYLRCVGQILDAGAHVRRGASGALGLAFVADGRTDAYVELHMNAWDCLAGLLLVREAGGRVGPYLQQDGLRSGGPVLAAAGGVAEALAATLGLALE